MIQSLFDETAEKNKEKQEHRESKIEAMILPENNDLLLEIPTSTDEREYQLSDSLEILDITSQTGITNPVFSAELNEETISSPEIASSQTSPSTPLPENQEVFSNLSESANLMAPEEVSREEPVIFKMPFEPEESSETVRKSGLAWAAGIALFGSVVFCLVLGWFADLLLGTSPWGIVAGIILGSIIGFLQFFRMTSQILKNKD